MIKMKNRGKLDAIYDILRSMNGPTRKTRMRHKSNMNYGMFNAYLDLMISKGLIVCKENGGKYFTYEITQQGENLLKAYPGLQQFLSYGQLE